MGGGVVWSSEDAHKPQHRLQAASRVIQYVKGAPDSSNDHRLPSTARFRKGRGEASVKCSEPREPQSPTKSEEL
eukprot:807167-Prorocentrum_minimum.AAC.1